MFHKLKTLTLLAAMLFTAASHAESIVELQAAIKASESKLSAINIEQKDLQTALSDIEQKIKAIANQPSPEKEAYQQAQQNLQAAESVFKADGSGESKAKMNNAQFKMALAERKYKKSNRALAELSEQQNEIQTKLATNQQSQSALNLQIKKHSDNIAQLKQQQIEREKARQVAKKNRELAAQRAEVARLKAALDASEKEKASLVATQKAAKAAAAVAASATITSPNSSSLTSRAAPATKPIKKVKAALSDTKPAAPVIKPVAISAPAEPIKAKTKSSTNKLPTTASSGNSKSAIYLDSRQAVEALENRLSIILSTPDKNKTAYDRMLNIKPADKNSRIKTRAQPLDSLGHGQYKGKGKLLAGDTIFAVGFYRWRQMISSQGDGQYTFLLDIADNKNPKLYYYPSTLGN